MFKLRNGGTLPITLKPPNTSIQREMSIFQLQSITRDTYTSPLLNGKRGSNRVRMPDAVPPPCLARTRTIDIAMW